MKKKQLLFLFFTSSALYGNGITNPSTKADVEIESKFPAKATLKKTFGAFIVNDGKALIRLESSMVIGAILCVGFYNLKLIKNLSYREVGTQKLNGPSKSDMYSKKLNAAAFNFFSSLTCFEFEQLCKKAYSQGSLEEAVAIKKLLIQSYNLYQFQAFLDCIRQWPEYKSTMLALAKRITADASFAKKLDQVDGFSRGKLRRFILEEIQDAIPLL
jgi:hypothetical protein